MFQDKQSEILSNVEFKSAIVSAVRTMFGHIGTSAPIELIAYEKNRGIIRIHQRCD